MSKKTPDVHAGFKRKDKGYSMHKEHWEIKYHAQEPNSEKNQVLGSSFNPLNTKDRAKTYNPVNETDT